MSALTDEDLQPIRHNGGSPVIEYPTIQNYACPAEWALLLVTDDGTATVLAIADNSEGINKVWDEVEKTEPQGLLMAQRLLRASFEFSDGTATSWMTSRAPVPYSPDRAAEGSA